MIYSNFIVRTDRPRYIVYRFISEPRKYLKTLDIKTNIVQLCKCAIKKKATVKTDDKDKISKWKAEKLTKKVTEFNKSLFT